MLIASPLTGEPEPALQWIEVSTSLQIPSFHIIGLPGPEVAEARERVRAAIEASGFAFPRRKVVLNLSPASIRKRGTGCDLAMALALLQLAPAQREKQGEAENGFLDGPAPVVAWGELGLDGRLKPAGGITRAVYASWKTGATALIISALVYFLSR